MASNQESANQDTPEEDSPANPQLQPAEPSHNDALDVEDLLDSLQDPGVVQSSEPTTLPSAIEPPG